MEPIILLRDVIDSDLPILFAHQADPVANEMAAFPARSWEAFAAHWARVRANDNAITKAIVYHDQVAGQIASFDMEAHREVGYWIGREFWGKGIATQALRQLLALEPQRPLYGYVVKHNTGSRRVLEKCGFQLVGEEGNDLILRLE